MKKIEKLYYIDRVKNIYSINISMILWNVILTLVI